MQKHFLAGVIVAAAVLVTLAPSPVSSSRAAAPADQTAILVGAGDIADCKDLSGAEATAKLLVQVPGTVMAVGDLAYPDGSKENFACYDKTWGRVKSRTRPAPGNHEFHAAGATPYFDYFGLAAAWTQRPATTATKLGTWHIVVLNSEMQGCRRLRSRFAAGKMASRRSCRTPFSLHPRLLAQAALSSGSAHGNDLTVKPLFQALFDNNADVVIGGHDHDYERFAPQTPDAAADPARGIREFVVGTGGKKSPPLRRP